MPRGRQKGETSESQKVLEVYVDKHGGIRIDGCWVDRDEDLRLYTGFAFRFVPACWMVSTQMIDNAKKRFARYGLLPTERRNDA